jgi:hypothetical protein
MARITKLDLGWLRCLRLLLLPFACPERAPQEKPGTTTPGPGTAPAGWTGAVSELSMPARKEEGHPQITQRGRAATNALIEDRIIG